MRRIGFAALSVVVLSIASAPQAGAQAPSVSAPVLAAATVDLNGDGTPDRAVLTAGKDGDVDFHVYLSANGSVPGAPTFTRAALGWTGDAPGTEPSLSVNRRGSLEIVFQNNAFGRHRFTRRLIVAWRDGGLTTAGYRYETSDTLDPRGARSCDVNFLTGKGFVDGKPIVLPPGPPPTPANWNDDESPPAACRF